MTSSEQLAAALAQLRNPARAIELLEAVIEQHPGSDAAEQARAYLFNLKNPAATESLEDGGPIPDPRVAHIILTTTSTIPGYEMSAVVEIVTAECVLGMNLFADFFASVRDVVGGRSEALQNGLRRARRICLDELRQEAFRIEADGVIGVSLNYSEVSGGGKSMVFLVASGTAVRLKKS